MASLPAAQPEAGEAVGRKLTEYLADVAKAWGVATAEGRNLLARQLFGAVLIENRTAVAVRPRPDLLPFFTQIARCQTPGDVTHGRKRRDSNPRSQP